MVDMIDNNIKTEQNKMKQNRKNGTLRNGSKKSRMEQITEIMPRVTKDGSDNRWNTEIHRSTQNNLKKPEISQFDKPTTPKDTSLRLNQCTD